MIVLQTNSKIKRSNSKTLDSHSLTMIFTMCPFTYIENKITKNKTTAKFNSNH